MKLIGITTAIRHKLGIQTKAEKKLQNELNVAAKKLEGESHDLFLKQLDGSIKHITVTDAEVDKFNKQHAQVLRKAGMLDPENPNLDKNYKYEYNDPWNPNYRG